MEMKFADKFKSSKETELQYLLRLYGDKGPLQIPENNESEDDEDGKS